MKWTDNQPRMIASVVAPYCHRVTWKGSSGGLAHTFCTQLYWLPVVSFSDNHPREVKPYRLAITMILALLPNRPQWLAYLRHCVAEMQCSLTIVAHDAIRETHSSGAYLFIRAKLESTRLFLGHVGITWREKKRCHFFNLCSWKTMLTCRWNLSIQNR